LGQVDKEKFKKLVFFVEVEWELFLPLPFLLFFLAGPENPLDHIKCRPVWWERRGTKLRNQNCFLDTSGPLLWYVRYNSLKRKSGFVYVMRVFLAGLYDVDYGKNGRFAFSKFILMIRSIPITFWPISIQNYLFGHSI
jgi:hypothetical protein